MTTSNRPTFCHFRCRQLLSSALGAFFVCSPYTWEGADWAPAIELQPYLRRNYKLAGLWFLFIYNKDFSHQNLSFPDDVAAFPEQGSSRPSVIFLLHFTATGSFGGLESVPTWVCPGPGRWASASFG